MWARGRFATEFIGNKMPSLYPYVPKNIVVHLGAPQSNAPKRNGNVSDYIKNVASSEIYPTWDEAAIYANIYAQITFALNRIYTEFYSAQGYNFNITNNTRIRPELHLRAQHF